MPRYEVHLIYEVDADSPEEARANAIHGGTYLESTATRIHQERTRRGRDPGRPRPAR